MNIDNHRTGDSTLSLVFSGAHDFQLQAAQSQTPTKAFKRVPPFPPQTKLN